MQHVSTHRLDCTASHFIKLLFLMIKLQNLLYCTVTTEKAAVHIVTSKIRKWPQREKFSASSSCCMNLWDRGILKLLEDTRDGFVNVLNVLLLYLFAVVVRKYFQRDWLYCTLFDRRRSKYIFAITVTSILYSQ